MSDHEYFCIHDDLFDIIQSTHQDRNILWKFISNELNEDESHSKAREIHDDNVQNKTRTATKYSTKHTLQKRRQEKVDYRKKTFDDFRLIIVDSPPKLNSTESYFLSSCYGTSMENQSNEVISKMVITHILKHWDESKTQFHPSSIAMTPEEHISLKICCIILKQCHIQIIFQ